MAVVTKTLRVLHCPCTGGMGRADALLKLGASRPSAAGAAAVISVCSKAVYLKCTMPQAGLVALEHFELAAAPGARIAAGSLPALLRSARSLRSVALRAITCAGAALPLPPAGSGLGLGPARLPLAGVTATVTLVGASPASRGKAADAEEAGGHAAIADAESGTDAAAVSWLRRAACKQLRECGAKMPAKAAVAGDAPAGAGAASGFGALRTLELAAGDLGDLRGLAALPALQCLKLRALGPCRGAEGPPRAWGPAPRPRAAPKSGSPRGAALERSCLAALSHLECLELHGVRCPDAVRHTTFQRVACDVL